MAEMRDWHPNVYQVRVVTDGQLRDADAIRHDKRLWLVPEWRESPDKQWTTPARIVCLEPFALKQTVERGKRAFVAQYQVPTGFFENPIPLALVAEFDVIDAPDIRFPIQRDIL